MSQSLRFLSIFLLCTVVDVCLSKPTETLVNQEAQNPVQKLAAVAAETEVKRDQRSPQFGFPEPGFGGFQEFEGGNRHQHHHRHHGRPGGCGEFGCDGYRPDFYPQQNGGGESFANANAESGNGPFGGGSQANAESGSFNFGGPGEFYPRPGGEGSFASANAGSANAGGFGGGSQANAESGSFNFGPLSGSFSIAQASSNDQGF